LMMKNLAWIFPGVLVLAAFSVHAQQGPAKESPPLAAVAVIMPMKGHDVHGVVILRQHDGFVHLTGKVEGLSPGEHGFHIHEFGDLRAADASSAGGHYDPHGHKHGGPDDDEKHAGDFGNIVADQNGVALVDKKSRDFKLQQVLGRTIVVHAEADDLTSQPSGDAGARIGVGVIGIAEVKKEAHR
jgi:superoxide dismutase, Cu-Zn family